MKTLPAALVAAALGGLLAVTLIACDGGGVAEPPSPEGAEAPSADPADPAGEEAASDGADAAQPPAGDAVADLVATVNGDGIAMADFQRQAFDTQRFFVEQGLDPNTEDGQRELLALRRQLLVDMINQVLVEQAALELGIEVSDADVEASLARVRQEMGGETAYQESMQAAETTPEEVFAMERSALVGQRVFEAVTREVPETAPFVRARHILCADEAACQAALGRLEAGEDFAAVAAEVSVDGLTASRGGDLEWVPRLEGFTYLPSAELQEAIVALSPGGRSGVVHTDYGYHVIEVVEEDASRAIDPERRNELRAQAMQSWLAERRAAADIVVYLDDLRDVVAEG